MTESRSSSSLLFSALLSQSTVRPTNPARTSWDMPRLRRYQATRSPIVRFVVIPRMGRASTRLYGPGENFRGGECVRS
ncbi:hypothetical protein SALBM311S_01864 [Streptomyces alboniger]